MSNSLQHQASLSMGFFRQEYWSGLPFPSQGDLPDPEMEPMSPTSAGRFFTTEPPALVAIIHLPTGSHINVLDLVITNKYTCLQIFHFGHHHLFFLHPSNSFDSLILQPLWDFHWVPRPHFTVCYTFLFASSAWLDFTIHYYNVFLAYACYAPSRIPIRSNACLQATTP